MDAYDTFLCTAGRCHAPTSSYPTTQLAVVSLTLDLARLKGQGACFSDQLLGLWIECVS
jgi:hypothetical protein